MSTFDTLIIEFDLLHHTFRKMTPEELTLDVQEKNKVYWIHCNLRQEECNQFLLRKIGLPQHVLEGCTEENHLSHITDNDDELTLQIKCMSSLELSDNHEIFLDNLIIHLTNTYCFTASVEPIPVLFEFLNKSQKAVHHAETPCFILFLLIEGIINDYAKVLFSYEELADNFESLIQDGYEHMYKKVVEVKHQVMLIKRYMIVIREILMRLTSRDIIVISGKCRASLANLSNHSHLIINEVDSIRDLLNSLMGQIDNEIMQKMSQTMTVLTAFAAIFLPLTLITGVYGMNFDWIPELHWKYGYFGALGLILGCGITLMLLFKKKKWL